MKKPIWIVFEGIDGSGKTTQAKMLTDYLNRKGIKCLYKHVFETDAGEKISKIFIENSFCNLVEILLLCATRKAIWDEILTIEKEYDVIILDRFFLSICAMQGEHVEELDLINTIKKIVCNDIRKIYTFYLNTNPVECKKRLERKKFMDRIEKKGVEFHTNVFMRYIDLLKNEENVISFDGESDEKALNKEIVKKTLVLLQD